MTNWQQQAAKSRIWLAVMQLVSAIGQRARQKTPPAVRLLNLSTAYWQSAALHAAVQLDLASRLAAQPGQTMTVDTLAAQTGVPASSLYRLLRYLAQLGVFKLDGQLVSHNDASSLLDNGRAVSFAPLVRLHQQTEVRTAWFSLADALQAGQQPFRFSQQQDFFSCINSVAAYRDNFAKAMQAVELLAGDSLQQGFAWAQCRRLLDYGGGYGFKAVKLLQANPGMTALVVDDAAVVQAASGFWQAQAHPCLSRLTFAAGDLTDADQAIPLPGAATDLCWFSAVFHGMSDAQVVQVLSRLTAACRQSGACVAIAELALGELALPALYGMDLQMLVCTDGQERSLLQWQALAAQAGFSLQQQVRLTAPLSVFVLTALP